MTDQMKKAEELAYELFCKWSNERHDGPHFAREFIAGYLAALQTKTDEGEYHMGLDMAIEVFKELKRLKYFNCASCSYGAAFDTKVTNILKTLAGIAKLRSEK